jgi:hypothetical protein
MRKSLAAIAAVATLAGFVVVVPGSAQAQRYYAPGYYYGPPPQSYYDNGAPGPVADPTGPCYWQRQRFWDGFGWRFRNIRVCG